MDILQAGLFFDETIYFTVYIPPIICAVHRTLLLLPAFP